MGKTKNVVMSGDTATTTKVDKYAAKKLEDAQQKAKITAPKHGKKILEARAKIDKNRLYPLTEAVSLAKDTSITKFDATVEFHAVLRREVSAQVTLPHGSGKEKKIEMANDETIKRLEAGKVDFDVLLATADMMPKLVRFAKLLGPRGLMPNPKNGTLVKDASAASKFSTNVISVKTEKGAPVMHVAVGKVSMSEKAIQENIEAILNGIGSRGLLKMYLSTSMGPSVKVNPTLS